MCTLTFFNEKGGVGKTTFNILFASWLAYEKGEAVKVFDFDFPSYQVIDMRHNDEDYCSSDESYAKMCSKTPYPIINVKGQNSYTKKDLDEIAEWFRAETAGPGYCICDFPGSFKPNDAIKHLTGEGLLDLVVFPVSTDKNTVGRALFVANVMRNPKLFSSGAGKTCQDVLFLWNNVTRDERLGSRNWFESTTRNCNLLGIPIAQVMVRDMPVLRRDAESKMFLRSTVCFPRVNVQRYCRWIIPLFEEIKDAADRAASKRDGGR